MLVDSGQSVAYLSINRGGNRGDKNRESMTMVDPFENIAADDGAAMAIFCGAPIVEYWLSAGGMVYRAACENDFDVERLRGDAHNVWRTLEGRRDS